MPLAQARCIPILGVHGENNGVHNVLSKNYDASQDLEATQQFLAACTCNLGVNKIGIELSFDDFCKFYKKQAENKLSLLSGLQYSQIKTLTHNTNLIELSFDII